MNAEKCIVCGDFLEPLNGTEKRDFALKCDFCELDDVEEDES